VSTNKNKAAIFGGFVFIGKEYQRGLKGAGISRVATSDTEPGSRKFVSDGEQIIRDQSVFLIFIYLFFQKRVFKNGFAQITYKKIARMRLKKSIIPNMADKEYVIASDHEPNI
jgi:hypothetical protein